MAIRLNMLFRPKLEYSSNEGGKPDYKSFTKLIIGLGNIGREFSETRHNIGFKIIDKYEQINNFEGWQEKPKFKCLMTEKIISGQKVILVKPITMMNLSGDSVRLIADFYKIKPADITVIYDEIDLDFGVVKKKVGGEGKSSHNGLKSISLALKSNDYNRIRFGINSNTPIKKRADFVLARFTKDEELELDKLTKLALELI